MLIHLLIIIAYSLQNCNRFLKNAAIAQRIYWFRYLASRAFVYTNARNRHPALPPDVCFSACWGSTPNPLNSPVAGAGCAFGSRTLLSLLCRDRRGLRPAWRRKRPPRCFREKEKKTGLAYIPVSQPRQDHLCGSVRCSSLRRSSIAACSFSFSRRTAATFCATRYSCISVLAFRYAG